MVDFHAAPSWSVPVELIRHSAAANGMALLLRWEALGADLAPIGRISRIDGRYVGHIDFLNPVGPERQTGLVIGLAVPLLEGRRK